MFVNYFSVGKYCNLTSSVFLMLISNYLIYCADHVSSSITISSLNWCVVITLYDYFLAFIFETVYNTTIKIVFFAKYC